MTPVHSAQLLRSDKAQAKKTSKWGCSDPPFLVSTELPPPGSFCTPWEEWAHPATTAVSWGGRGQRVLL